MALITTVGIDVGGERKGFQALARSCHIDCCAPHCPPPSCIKPKRQLHSLRSYKPTRAAPQESARLTP